ncbi:tRNA lysidine(34) synthetase TilS [Moheibacter sediminis]|uniref:tRNA(Ile)-lysidine synthase n=1 Tax=Moheibacter sediminis TaxID=1434700 RepID=A0A1W1ZAD9_9FLAO|nr:tRNA lysidine(34) synthetase TilS [Moheibacter sediminis]SMC45410.1 tRNA(Ile)-lysidine synthase [Moheibacter sediminis]
MEFLLSEFKNNINRLSKISQSKFLIAVSGGIDSMVLCDLFLKLKLNFSVAHCNFQLRGNDSDLDEEFVRNYCIQNQIKFHSKTFNVKEYKQSGNHSTQMAARDLRYAWFKKLMQENQFNLLVTAHHLNDSLETFLINLSRGSGINGLTGIQFQQNEIIRPLYNISKKSILEYAGLNQIRWREDVSNATDDYIRNKIRNQIVPVLNEIHPEFLANFSKSIQILKDEKTIIQNQFENLSDELFISAKNNYSVSIQKLKELQPFNSSLFHLFSKFGFMHPLEIERLMDANEGSEINSNEYRLIKNRGELILSRQTKIKESEEFIVEDGKLIQKPLNLRLSKSEVRDFSASETLDVEKISFPLRLRKAKTGDVFFPFGMRGSKKLSKFFKDEKFSKIDKEDSWLLVDDEDRIVYVTGIRIDDRFKITENTHKFLNIYLC